MFMLGGGGSSRSSRSSASLFVLGVGGGDPSPAEVRAEARRGRLHAARVENAQPGDHTLGPDDTSPGWNTDPPTSGPHFGFDQNQNLGTVIWGAYEEPVQLARVVHNLEHGGIYIFYGNKVADRGRRRAARRSTRITRTGRSSRRCRRLGNQIALGAWVVHGARRTSSGYLAKCDEVRRGGVLGVLPRLPVQGPRALPRGHAPPGRKLEPPTLVRRGGGTGETRPP